MIKNLRSGDDDFGVNHLLLKDTVLALLVGGGDESVSLVLEPLADSKLVLCGAEEAGLLFGVLLALWKRRCVVSWLFGGMCPCTNGSNRSTRILTSYKQRRTLPCREEEAVSVLTPPIWEVAAREATR